MKACPLCAEVLEDHDLVCPYCDAQATPSGWRVVDYAGPGGPVSSGTNGMAIASFVCSLLFFVWFVPSILAVTFGFVAKRQLRESMGQQAGAGLATAGIVLGWMGVALLAVLVFFAVTRA